MRIGFDAKRAFFNKSGLGNYSRDTIRILGSYYPDNHYFLFTPDDNLTLYELPDVHNLDVVKPDTPAHKTFPAYWRSLHLRKSIRSQNLDIFHGLSNELPNDIRLAGVRSVVTIHDLIYLRHPEFYKRIDRFIYQKKSKGSCAKADRIIAISRQTRDDLMEFYGLEEDRITIVYQGCSPIFYYKVEENVKKTIQQKYKIPSRYLLQVGTLEERKNAMATLRAIRENRIDIPLVLAGRRTSYARKLTEYIERHKMNHVYILDELDFKDLPAIYQMAEATLYPSFFEGFGIPILEALNSRVPVITTAGGCFHEAGGEHSLYIDPNSPEEIAAAIQTLLTDSAKRDNIIEKSYQHALGFRDEHIGQNLMEVYKSLLS